MAKTIEACIKKQNALLESPPGTNKTINLIWAIMGFIESEQQKQNSSVKNSSGSNENVMNQASYNDDIPNLIICVQKQSEINSIVHKIRQWPYTPKVNVLSSKRSLWINEEVKSQKDLSMEVACKRAVENFENNSDLTLKCAFKANVDEYMQELNNEQKESDSDDKIMDIEDLNRLGTTHKICPYYL